MRFVFLGTGTSAGIPMIGCECETCVSEDPRDRRLRTAAAIEFTDAKGMPRTILLDAGPDLRIQALREKLTRCDAIVFTHNHVDHTFGLDEVRRFNAVQKHAIEVHADGHTMESLERVYKHIFDRDRNTNDSFVATLIAFRISEEDIQSGRPTVLHGLHFIPIELMHGRLRVLGWRIEPEPSLPMSDEARALFPLAYCTDVSAIPPQSWSRLTGLKTLVLDALRHRHHPTHLTLDEAVKTASHLAADRTFFVHMAHDLAHAATNESLPESMSLAYDGLSLPG